MGRKLVLGRGSGHGTSPGVALRDSDRRHREARVGLQHVPVNVTRLGLWPLPVPIV